MGANARHPARPHVMCNKWGRMRGDCVVVHHLHWNLQSPLPNSFILFRLILARMSWMIRQRRKSIPPNGTTTLRADRPQDLESRTLGVAKRALWKRSSSSTFGTAFHLGWLPDVCLFWTSVMHSFVVCSPPTSEPRNWKPSLRQLDSTQLRPFRIISLRWPKSRPSCSCGLSSSGLRHRLLQTMLPTGLCVCASTCRTPLHTIDPHYIGPRYNGFLLSWTVFWAGFWWHPV